MKRILVLGAGLSASSLIRYLLQHAEEFNWQVQVTDVDPELVKKKLNGHPAGIALHFDALDSATRRTYIEKSDLVISMLPAKYHVDVARDCIALHKNLITPSYVSPEMKALGPEAEAADITIMNEIGVDPGIDHMSAMKIIDEIHEQGGEIHSFKSFCGGLIAPESDTNSWNYKFTWNPKNVVLAGSGGMAQYIQKGQYKFTPYQQIFSRLDHIAIEGFGKFEGYANRDSLSYRSTYGLDSIPTMYRGTLRRPGFSANWNIFVQLGMTDDQVIIANSENISARAFVNMFLPFDIDRTVEEKMQEFAGRFGVNTLEKFNELDLFDDNYIPGLKDATAARLLEKILTDHWKLEEGDRDMLVMVHQFEYELDGKSYELESSMVNIGEDQLYTSMANTVGLPMAICAKLMLTNKISQRGVIVPTAEEVYLPILSELEGLGITFNEATRAL